MVTERIRGRHQTLPHLVVPDLEGVDIIQKNWFWDLVVLGEGAAVSEQPNAGGQIGDESFAFDLEIRFMIK